jgi:hypothetical protein
MVAFGWATDRLGPQISLFGMAAIFWLTAAASLALWKFGDVSQVKSGTDHRDNRVAC